MPERVHSSEGLGLIRAVEQNFPDVASMDRQGEVLRDAFERGVVEGEDEVLVSREALGLVIWMH